LGQEFGLEGYDVLVVSGDSWERGYEYGSHHSDIIRALVESHFMFYGTLMNLTREATLRNASKYIKPCRDYSQDIASELQGMSEGAGATLEEIMLIAAFPELLHPNLAGGCTSFAVRAGATEDGLTYVGQNNDESSEPWLDGRSVTLTSHLQKNAPDVLIYSYAGVPAMAGINSWGLSLCGNALGFDEPRVGVPMQCIAREILNQRSIEDAVGSIERAKRASALNFVIGSTDGIADIEANSRRVAVVRSSDVLWHANHYMYCEAGEFPDKWSDEYRENSQTRCAQMRHFLMENKGKIGLQMLEEFLRDHTNEPDSICVHTNPERKGLERTRTFDGIIYIPERKVAQIARGNPCKSAFKEYSITNR
jgi:isopenicillin-N N-acyltransferase like protein